MIQQTTESASGQDPIRYDWADPEIRAIHDLPLLELVFRAQQVHRRFHDPSRVQLATLLSIKTGGCSEDCGYCAQSVRHGGGVQSEQLMEVQDVLAKARDAREAGSTRFCMGAAWRRVRDGTQLDRIVEMIRGVSQEGLEVCCTLGMLTEEQAQRLAAAGLTAYNHNLDTGPDYYDQVISSHTFEERLQTLHNVRKAGINLCCGGIIGMGESVDDRIAMLGTLARLEHPESVPINALVPVPGTPLANAPSAQPLEMVRMIATTRIVMPASRVRLSAGRAGMSVEAQALCFLAGANSIFAGDKLLTTPNAAFGDDLAMLEALGLQPMERA